MLVELNDDPSDPKQLSPDFTSIQNSLEKQAEKYSEYLK